MSSAPRKESESELASTKSEDAQESTIKIEVADDAGEATKCDDNSPQVTTDIQKGLTAAEAADSLAKWGKNELHIEPIAWYTMVFEEMTTTMAIMLELACLLSLALMDWPDFGIVLSMIVVNVGLGYHEKMKAKKSLDELTSSQIVECPIVRDGKSKAYDVKDIVPGDLILLAGGQAVPADVVWVRGDVLAINTAATTGEGVPRKYPGQYGTLIQQGNTVAANTAYAVVLATGENTMIGQSQMCIAADKQQGSVSVFEAMVMGVVKVFIGLSLVIVAILLAVQGVARQEFVEDWKKPLLMALSIMVAAVPVALPLVMQVTMALGAGVMARDHHAIVTKSSALQDIAAMTTLCTDKTGTLTTANMSIFNDKIKTYSSHSDFDVLLYARLCSNPDKKDDPIDVATIRAYEEFCSANGKDADAEIAAYTKTGYEGFNATVKRVTGFFDGPKGKMIICKGIISKVLDTTAGTNDEGTQWKCENLDTVGAEAQANDIVLSKSGYKTIGIGAKIGDEAMQFVGILPMIDPPRCDTAQVINKIHNAGIGIKMITGDHKNIAIETARIVGLKTQILDGSETRGGSNAVKRIVLEAGGFAQVTMQDKREVVDILQKDWGQLVGMMGDGVNDAPALSAARCGIAVDGATDAAKNAADIILTAPGLGATYGAIVESRRIFARLKAYITYRLAATIQVVVFISMLVLAYDCEVKPLFVILLAFFSDVTMTPISVDNAQASKKPVDTSNPIGLVSLSSVFGAVEVLMSFLFFQISKQNDMLSGFDATPVLGTDFVDCGDLNLSGFNASVSSNITAGCKNHHDDYFNTVTQTYHDKDDYGDCSNYMQAAVFLQLVISAEMLIFSTRAPGLFFLSRPSTALMCSTALGCLIVTILCAQVDYFGGLEWGDIGIIYAWNIGGLIIADLSKLAFMYFYDHDTAGVIEDDEEEEEEEATTPAAKHAANCRRIEAAQKSKRFSSPALVMRPARGRLDSVRQFLSTGALYDQFHLHHSNDTLKWRANHGAQSMLMSRPGRTNFNMGIYASPHPGRRNNFTSRPEPYHD